MNFLIVFVSLYMSTSSVFALDLQVSPKVTSADFKELTPEIKIRVGSDPWMVEIRAEEKAIQKFEFRLSPVLPEKYLRTVGVKESRHNCIIEDENGGGSDGTPDIRNNAKEASVKAKFNWKFYDIATKTLSLKIPAPFVVDNVTQTFEYEITIGKAKFPGKLNLDAPLSLHPVLAEILKQQKKISATVIQSSFPPVIKRVETDICSDTDLETVDFSKCEPLSAWHECDHGTIGDYRVIQRGGWVFAAKSKKDPFPFELVRADSMTFLGDYYSHETLHKGKIENDKLKIHVTLGGFSGCFGSGCGEPLPIREAFVSVDKKGVMSTVVRKSTKRDHEHDSDADIEE